MIDAIELPKTGVEAPANRLVIGLAQIDCTVGDIAGNLVRMRAARAEAAAFGADLVMFSELFIAGYPPEDLVLKPAFVEACRTACEAIAVDTSDGGPAILVGLPWGENGHCYNAFALLDKGRIEAIRFKVDLPNYGVFDDLGPGSGRMHLRDGRRDSPCSQWLTLLARQDK
jgi:NAD+ synthase